MIGPWRALRKFASLRTSLQTEKRALNGSYYVTAVCWICPARAVVSFFGPWRIWQIGEFYVRMAVSGWSGTPSILSPEPVCGWLNCSQACCIKGWTIVVTMGASCTSILEYSHNFIPSFLSSLSPLGESYALSLSKQDMLESWPVVEMDRGQFLSHILKKKESWMHIFFATMIIDYLPL